MDTGAYLDRIGYRGSQLANLETLKGLQLSHMLSVPFENLSIQAKEPILLEEESLFDKIVLRRRGGFCYELNGLFGTLLRGLGFDVTRLSAGVAKAEGGFGPDFDHMTLMVVLEEKWLVDVGFGDSFQQPLLIDNRDPQVRDSRSYQIDNEGDYFILRQSEDSGDWKAQYRFTLRPRQLAEYTEMCQYHQTSPQSSFTQKRVCSIATTDGRLTLSDMQWIKRSGDERRERILRDEGEYAEVLAKDFGIIMGK